MSTVRNVLLGSPRRRGLTLLVIAAGFCLIVLEAACQIVGMVQLSALAKARQDPGHYYQPTDDPALVYELKRGYTTEKDGRRLKINSRSFREDSEDTFADKQRIAIFGDSVVFGTGLSQEQTIPAQVQAAIDPGGERVRILNCGTPGYGLAEFPAHLRRVLDAYKPQLVVYVLNPNDFVIRDTLYEGADNGLYKQYRSPVLKTPWVVRKAIYRMKKGGVSPSNAWYRWTYDGTKSRLMPRFAELRDMCRAAGSEFRVVFLPVRGSFDPADKAIVDIYREIGAALNAQSIPWTDPTPAFAAAGATSDPAGGKLIDATDHLTAEGCRVMAEAMKPALRLADTPAVPTPAPPAPGS